jgi:hypothetical protein
LVPLIAVLVRQIRCKIGVKVEIRHLEIFGSDFLPDLKTGVCALNVSIMEKYHAGKLVVKPIPAGEIDLKQTA